jgi:hypothetical protein
MQISYGTQDNAHTATRINAGRQTVPVASHSFRLSCYEEERLKLFYYSF